MKVKVYIGSIETRSVHEQDLLVYSTRTSCSAQRTMHRRESNSIAIDLYWCILFLWGVFVKSYIDNQMPLCFYRITDRKRKYNTTDLSPFSHDKVPEQSSACYSGFCASIRAAQS